MSDPIFLKKWIDELEEKIAEKDKRIEELKKESEWKAMKQLLCADYHIITTEQLASGEVVLLTQGQIDAAWKYVRCNHSAETWDSLMTLLAGFGVLPCDYNGCSNGYVPNGSGISPCSRPCPACHGHGWKVTTGADLMASGDWVDDNE